MAETQRRPGEQPSAHAARSRTASAAATATHTAKTNKYRSQIGMGDQGAYSKHLKATGQSDSEEAAQSFLDSRKPKASRSGRTAADAGNALAKSQPEP